MRSMFRQFCPSCRGEGDPPTRREGATCRVVGYGANTFNMGVDIYRSYKYVDVRGGSYEDEYYPVYRRFPGRG